MTGSGEVIMEEPRPGQACREEEAGGESSGEAVQRDDASASGYVRVSKTTVRSTVATIVLLCVLLLATNVENFSFLKKEQEREGKYVVESLETEKHVSLLFEGRRTTQQGQPSPGGGGAARVGGGKGPKKKKRAKKEKGANLLPGEPDPEDLERCAPAFAAVRETSLRVGNVPAVPRPFPHLVLDDVFPSDYYQLMLDNVIDTRRASEDLFTRRSAVKPRYTLILRPNVTEYSRGDEDDIKKKVEFWRCHYLAYGSAEFTAALLRPFRSIVERRYNGTVKYNAKKFYQAMSLVQDRTEYFITPHTDVYTKFVTNLFYLSSESDAEFLRTSGTLIMEPVGSTGRKRKKKKKRAARGRSLQGLPPRGEITTLESFDSSKVYLENQGVVYKFKQMEFRPNRLVAFAPCDSSWHSVPLQKLKKGVFRNTVQGFVSFDGRVPEKESCVPRS